MKHTNLIIMRSNSKLSVTFLFATYSFVKVHSNVVLPSSQPIFANYLLMYGLLLTTWCTYRSATSSSSGSLQLNLFSRPLGLQKFYGRIYFLTPTSHRKQMPEEEILNMLSQIPARNAVALRAKGRSKSITVTRIHSTWDLQYYYTRWSKQSLAAWWRLTEIAQLWFLAHVNQINSHNLIQLSQPISLHRFSVSEIFKCFVQRNDNLALFM